MFRSGFFYGNLSCNIQPGGYEAGGVQAGFLRLERADADGLWESGGGGWVCGDAEAGCQIPLWSAAWEDKDFSYAGQETYSGVSCIGCRSGRYCPDSHVSAGSDEAPASGAGAGRRGKGNAGEARGCAGRCGYGKPDGGTAGRIAKTAGNNGAVPGGTCRGGFLGEPFRRRTEVRL